MKPKTLTKAAALIDPGPSRLDVLNQKLEAIHTDITELNRKIDLLEVMILAR